jgi:hypothetical protein
MMLATSTVTTSMDDIILWADTTWCYRSEFTGYGWRSDDYTVISAGCVAWSEFLNSEQDEPQFPDHWQDNPMLDALEAHYGSLPFNPEDTRTVDEVEAEAVKNFPTMEVFLQRMATAEVPHPQRGDWLRWNSGQLLDLEDYYYQCRSFASCGGADYGGDYVILQGDEDRYPFPY